MKVNYDSYPNLVSPHTRVDYIFHPCGGTQDLSTLEKYIHLLGEYTLSLL